MTWLSFWGSWASIFAVFVMAVSAIRYAITWVWGISKAIANEQKDYERFVESIKTTGSTLTADPFV